MSEHAAERPIVDAEQAKPVEDEVSQSRGERARKSGYRSRFGVVYFGLAILAGAGVGSLVVLLLKADPPPKQAWSQWEPTGSPTERLYQITNRIPKRYRQDGAQLVSAAVNSPQVSVPTPDGQLVTVPVQRIAISEEGDLTQVDAGSTLQFTLSGTGEGGAIAVGKPSTDRYALIQRQALELALYALKYVEDLESVAVLLPPSKSQDPAAGAQQPRSTAVFLRRSDVKTALSRPLRATLKPFVPDMGAMSAVDRRALNTIAIPNTFQYQYDQAQDGAFVMLLAGDGLGG